MELIDPITHNNAAFFGWDRTGNNPSSGTGIHHPAGMVMKISFDDNSLTPNSSSILWDDWTYSPVNSHWVVGLDNGTVEHGSSGSPLFDQNHRVVGQLHGGGEGCAPVTEYYGRLNVSWAGGGSNSSRLSNWLDPNNTGATILDHACLPVFVVGRYFETDATVTSCGDILVWSVNVINGAKLTLDAAGVVRLLDNVTVELGSQLEIKGAVNYQ
jgi:hypothetical protein